VLICPGNEGGAPESEHGTTDPRPVGLGQTLPLADLKCLSTGFKLWCCTKVEPLKQESLEFCSRKALAVWMFLSARKV